MARVVYLDSSALVKLAVREPESDALRKHLRRRQEWVTSAVARTEVLRALLPSGQAAVAAGHGVLARCDLIRVNDRVLALAATLLPVELRSLDAIHLATAERLRGDLAELITYDARMLTQPAHLVTRSRRRPEPAHPGRTALLEDIWSLGHPSSSSAGMSR